MGEFIDLKNHYTVPSMEDTILHIHIYTKKSVLISSIT